MKAITVLLACILVAVSALAQSNEPAKGFAIIKRDLVFPDKADDALPRLSEKQVVPCVRVQDDGYLIVCHDAAGQARIAFLPVRDEWGHSTAKAWIYDSSLPTNTALIQTPLPLQPGYVPLEKGRQYPVVDMDDKNMVILFSLADLSRKLTVPRTDAELVPPPPPPKPETDPMKIRARQLELSAEESKAQLDELQKRLDTARTNTTRIAAVLKELAQLEIEKGRVKAELLKSEATCKELAAALPPPQQPALNALSRDAEKLAQEQAKFEAKLQKSQLEMEPLKTLHKQLLSTEEDLEKLKVAADSRQAELNAFQKAHAQEDIKQDKNLLRTFLDATARQTVEMAGQLQQLDVSKASLKGLYERYEATQQENQQLRTQLQTLTTELQDLQKKIRDLQKPQAEAPKNP